MKTRTVCPPVPSEDRCQCDCHATGAIHFMPCCSTCEDCGEHMIFVAWQEHKAGQRVEKARHPKNENQ